MKHCLKQMSVLAAILVSSSMLTGVAAQSTDSETVSVEVTSLLCAIDLGFNDTETQDFGVWRWNGTSYQPTSIDQPRIHFDATFLTDVYGGCDVSVAFTGLAGPGGTIDPTHFSAWALSQAAGHTERSPAAWTDLAVPGPTYHFNYLLNSIPDTITPGTYSGTMTINVANTV